MLLCRNRIAVENRGHKRLIILGFLKWLRVSVNKIGIIHDKLRGDSAVYIPRGPDALPSGFELAMLPAL